jgi:L-ascorbate metabolism protein UlaG (beta-lactamase superfamily)
VARQAFQEWDAAAPGLLSAPGPALYRLQHASLFFQDGPTGIIVDPHFHSTYDSAPGPGIDYAEVNGHVSAILISHSHEDHFHLSSLAMFPKNTLILVAKVPRPTVICPNMADLLRQCGFTNVVEAEWYKTNLQVANMKIWTFPFYGEQPLETEYPRFPDLRNWGNTYVVEVNGVKTWFLIDSGQDITGAMVDVASRIRETLGPVDIILSNLRAFKPYSPFYINCGLNWLTLAYDQIPGLTHRPDCLTLGTAKVAKICKIVGATLYLPYAHWWGGIGEVGDSGLDTPDQEEEPLLGELNGDLLNINCSTRILPWRIGDSLPLHCNLAEQQRRPASTLSHAVAVK